MRSKKTLLMAVGLLFAFGFGYKGEALSELFRSGFSSSKPAPAASENSAQAPSPPSPKEGAQLPLAPGRQLPPGVPPLPKSVDPTNSGRKNEVPPVPGLDPSIMGPDIYRRMPGVGVPSTVPPNNAPPPNLNNTLDSVRPNELSTELQAQRNVYFERLQQQLADMRAHENSGTPGLAKQGDAPLPRGGENLLPPNSVPEGNQGPQGPNGPPMPGAVLTNPAPVVQSPAQVFGQQPVAGGEAANPNQGPEIDLQEDEEDVVEQPDEPAEDDIVLDDEDG